MDQCIVSVVVCSVWPLLYVTMDGQQLNGIHSAVLVEGTSVVCQKQRIVWGPHGLLLTIGKHRQVRNGRQLAVCRRDQCSMSEKVLLYGSVVCYYWSQWTEHA